VQCICFSCTVTAATCRTDFDWRNFKLKSAAYFLHCFSWQFIYGAWVIRAWGSIHSLLEHIELPAKLPDYFLRSNKSNIDQCVEWVICAHYARDIVRKLFPKTSRHRVGSHGDNVRSKVKIAFMIAQKRNNVVVLFGTFKVQSFILTEVSNCSLLIVVTSCTFLKRTEMLKEKSS